MNIANAGMPASRGPHQPINLGVVFSVVFHAVLILYLLHLVRPNLNILAPKPRQAVVQLLPPLPPPPPPPLKQQVPRTATPPQPTPAPPKAINTVTPTPVAPPAPAEPPVVAPTPPAPPPRVVGTSVPGAYYSALQALIQQATRYPKESLADQEEGDCMVRVTFGRDGFIEATQLVKASGYSGLDGECQAVFKRIGKFPAIPENANPDATAFTIELPINFALQ
jgi:periplasmic protein TonB